MPNDLVAAESAVTLEFSDNGVFVSGLVTAIFADRKLIAKVALSAVIGVEMGAVEAIFAVTGVEMGAVEAIFAVTGVEMGAVEALSAVTVLKYLACRFGIAGRERLEWDTVNI